MNTHTIEPVLTLAENYVVRTTFDSSDVEAAIFTLEQAQATALNNAPIYFAEGDIEGWRLCMNHAAQFNQAIGYLKSLGGVVLDSASAMKSVDANIKRGREAMNKVITQKKHGTPRNVS